jgi:chemotaxis protein MotB
MSPKYLQAAPANRDRWMVSYLDVVTILLIFFLFAAAKGLDHPVQAAPLIVSVPAGRPVENEGRRAGLMHAQQLLEQQGLDLKMEEDGLVISLSQGILFSSGEDTVDPAALPLLARIAGVLQDLPDNKIRLVGHADTVPIHNRRFRNNWDLSMARSLRILDLLTEKFGIPESRLSIAGNGPYRPAGPNDTVDGRASNRRVEIVILDGSPEPHSSVSNN